MKFVADGELNMAALLGKKKASNEGGVVCLTIHQLEERWYKGVRQIRAESNLHKEQGILYTVHHHCKHILSHSTINM